MKNATRKPWKVTGWHNRMKGVTNMQIQNSTQSVGQPKVITGLPWALGFEDGARGRSHLVGVEIYTGRQLREYRRGWSEGSKVKQH